MRYVTNADDYLVAVSFGADVECEWGICTQYEGEVPAGYSSLDDWYLDEAERLCRWKIVDGQLTKDMAAKAPKSKTVFDLIYPVGSIYLSVSPVSPADLFGGTWEQIQDTFLLAAGMDHEAGTTGGEAEHTLTVEELPEHTHRIYREDYPDEYPYYYKAGHSSSSSGWGYVTSSTQTGARVVAGYEGGGVAHNNMPPYLAVYMWKRVEDPVLGGLTVEDDDAGNVTITTYGTAVIENDGAGNANIVDPVTTSVADDGAGNVTII